MSVPPPIPPAQPSGPQTISYATGFVQPATPVLAWEQDGMLVTARRCHLPDLCVKCGAKADKTFSRTYYWHEPLLYLTILAGVLIYFLVAVIVRKNTKLTFGLCHLHNSKRVKNILIAWCIALLGVGVFVASIALLNRVAGREMEPYGAFGIPLAIVLMIGAGVYAALTTNILKPKRMDAQYAWFTGAEHEFLRQLPQA